ncbi:Hypothetical Protein XCAW_02503 [Xanthomonas citri subsp. citri Aw12879]|nr:Hypothetical Protein XCAW_02503 [Xanthomonas citri subsp. citri Aw12879]
MAQSAAVLIVTQSQLPMRVSRNTVVQPHTHVSRAFDPRSADLVGRFPCEGKRPFFCAALPVRQPINRMRNLQEERCIGTEAWERLPSPRSQPLDGCAAIGLVAQDGAPMAAARRAFRQRYAARRVPQEHPNFTRNLQLPTTRHTLWNRFQPSNTEWNAQFCADFNGNNQFRA